MTIISLSSTIVYKFSLKRIFYLFFSRMLSKSSKPQGTGMNDSTMLAPLKNSNESLRLPFSSEAGNDDTKIDLETKNDFGEFICLERSSLSTLAWIHLERNEGPFRK
jgi:hypothetical protein